MNNLNNNVNNNNILGNSLNIIEKNNSRSERDEGGGVSKSERDESVTEIQLEKDK